MSSWQELVAEYYKIDHQDPDTLVIGVATSKKRLDRLEKVLGVSLPAEFRDFYSLHDGFGTKKSDGSIDWFFEPIANIPKWTATSSVFFAETHPKLAARFVAFINWSEFNRNGYLGSSSGYIFDESKKSDGEIYVFEPDLYEVDEDQDSSDFLYHQDGPIREFLTPAPHSDPIFGPLN